MVAQTVASFFHGACGARLEPAVYPAGVWLGAWNAPAENGAKHRAGQFSSALVRRRFGVLSAAASEIGRRLREEETVHRDVVRALDHSFDDRIRRKVLLDGLPIHLVSQVAKS
ncbi:hypothetical protein [Candidatus Methylacidithermus pantelleriae]|uniref:hypothetical protein n=1 Tax=Candidatus Methylacidithermus pantelleriae TaxID=2744239 RepID=UPI001BD22DE3|nr:hypothetical protein [Candidatus Methylacidithermus pantelleriae]